MIPVQPKLAAAVTLVGTQDKVQRGRHSPKNCTAAALWLALSHANTVLPQAIPGSCIELQIPDLTLLF